MARKRQPKEQPPVDPVNPKLRAVQVEDSDAEPWMAEAARVWSDALESRDPIRHWQEHGPTLPEWSGSPHVTRAQFGRFLADRDSGLVHDAKAATEACGLDGIANATWVHFWPEVLTAVPDAEPCPHCLAPDA